MGTSSQKILGYGDKGGFIKMALFGDLKDVWVRNCCYSIKCKNERKITVTDQIQGCG